MPPDPAPRGPRLPLQLQQSIVVFEVRRNHQEMGEPPLDQTCIDHLAIDIDIEEQTMVPILQRLTRLEPHAPALGQASIEGGRLGEVGLVSFGGIDPEIPDPRAIVQNGCVAIDHRADGGDALLPCRRQRREEQHEQRDGGRTRPQPSLQSKCDQPAAR